MKLKCQKCGEWSGYIAGGLISEYTCEKCNTNTIKINNLKIGDRIKYGTNNSDNGIIVSINHQLKIFFIKIEKYSMAVQLEEKDIISKLEPLPPQYKEIKIEHPLSEEDILKLVNVGKEVMNSIKISDLKIGDKIKYYAPDSLILDTTILDGKITEIKIDYVRINDAFLISKNKIISKLKPRNIVNINNETLYEEIPIEKEEEYLPPWWENSKKENMKWALYQECSDNTKVGEHSLTPKNEEKSAPKSFSTDFRIARQDNHYMHFTEAPLVDILGKGTYTRIEFDIRNMHINHDFFDWKKTYTIEIKEKE